MSETREEMLKSLIARHHLVLNRFEPHLGCCVCRGELTNGRCLECDPLPAPNPWPNHLLLAAGDTATLCGIKHREKRFYPHCLMEFAPDHAYPMARCVECYTRAFLTNMLSEEDYDRDSGG